MGTQSKTSRKGDGGSDMTPQNFGHRLRSLVAGFDTDFSNECELCGEGPMVYAAITSCGHCQKMCWLCAVRVSRLQRHRTGLGVKEHRLRCIQCRRDLSVALSRKKCFWDRIDLSSLKHDSESECYCVDDAIYEAVRLVQEYRCWVPECTFGWGEEQPDEAAWKEHIRTQHKKRLCEACYEARKANLFPAENSMYAEGDLGRHRRQGDGDGNAHLHCRVCRQWLFDEIAFERHWRESDSHEMCALCYTDGLTTALFGSMESVRRHWQECHFPCLEASCEEKHVVFRDSRSLQLHMAKEHLRNSSYFENIGRRGILLRLDQPEEAPFRSSRRRAAKTETDMDDDAACALWPPELVAEAPRLLDCIRRAPSEWYGSAERCQKAAQSWYAKFSRQFIDEADRDAIAKDCHDALKLAQDDKPGVASCLQNIVHLTTVRAARWRPQSRQLRDGDREPQTIKPFPEQREHSLSLRSAFLLAIILAVPLDRPKLSAAYLSALELVAKRSEEAKQTITQAEPIARGREDSAREEEEEDDEAGVRRVLSDCSNLPINRNVTFIVACEWALREYLARITSLHLNFPPCKCPVKVPIAVLNRMRASYSKEDFETFRFIVRDLGEYIPEIKLRECFMRLRPWYLNHKLQVRRSRLGQGSSGGGRPPDPADLRTSPHSPLEMSKKWGQQCDQAFHNFHPQELQLLRQYCCEVRILLPSALPIQEHLVSGVDRSELFGTEDPPLPHHERVLDTQTRQFVPALGTRQIDATDFPELPTPNRLPAGRSLAWSSSPRTRAPAARPQTVGNRGTATRMAEPPAPAEQFPALGGSRRVPRR